MMELLLVAAIWLALIAHWHRQQRAHERRLRAYAIRIHVNGIRGKSTVTRLVAGVLRQAGYRTVAKTTGSLAVLIDPDGADRTIERSGPVNVREQQAIIAAWEPLGAEAMVIECMAVHPKNQEWAERMVIQAHVGVITNVREDHQDVMGHSLPEIARSLARMCPRDGVLVTAEADPALQDVLRSEARRRGCRFVVADPARVSRQDVSAFDYLSFADNIATALAVADLLGIDRSTALLGMAGAPADVGATRLQRLSVRGAPVLWANLFAVNDRESAVVTMAMLEPHCDERTVRIGILNNRTDREVRAERFCEIAVRDIAFDWLVTFGAFETLVTRSLVRHGFPRERIANLGDDSAPSLEAILDTIAAMIPPGGNALLVGLVNIHTAAAELLLDHFARQAQAPAMPTASPRLGPLRRERREHAHARQPALASPGLDGATMVTGRD